MRVEVPRDSPCRSIAYPPSPSHLLQFGTAIVNFPRGRAQLATVHRPFCRWTRPDANATLPLRLANLTIDARIGGRVNNATSAPEEWQRRRRFALAGNGG